MSTKTTGDYGESLACKYLQGLGYKILERNFRIRGGEIDIIAKDKEDLVFVEVKTRYTHDFGSPEESITPWKVHFLVRASQFYLLKHSKIDVPYRIDVLTVDFVNSSNKPNIGHFKNITS